MTRNRLRKTSLALYGLFLFKWGGRDGFPNPDLDPVLGDDNGGLGWGPDGQRGIIGDIGPSDLFWRNSVHYYYTRLSALSPLFDDRLDHLALGFGSCLVCGWPFAEDLVEGLLALRRRLYELLVARNRLVDVLL